MAEFYIAPDKLKAPADELSACRTLLKEYRAEVSSVRFILKKSLGISFRSLHNLSEISDRLSAEAESCVNLSTGLNNIVQTYERSEKHVCEYVVNGKTWISWAEILSNNDINTTDDRGGRGGYGINGLFQDFFKANDDGHYEGIIAATGPFGTIIDGVKQFADGEYGKSIADIVKFAGGLVKNIEGTKIDWAEWIGLNPIGEKPWKYALSDYFDFSNARNGFSSVCNWATAIITSGYDNLKEFGDGWFSNPRFWGETATETLINVGEGIAMTAAAAAILGTSAPAVAVGVLAAVGTVAVDAGVNGIIRLVTGDPNADWKEIVSDAVCDGFGTAVEWVKENGAVAVEWAKEAGQAAVDWVVDTGQAVTDWAVDTASDIVEGIGEGINNFGNSVCGWLGIA